MKNNYGQNQAFCTIVIFGLLQEDIHKLRQRVHAVLAKIHIIDIAHVPEKPFHGAKIFVIMIQTARDTLNTRLNHIAVFPQQPHAPANVQGLGMMGKAVNCVAHVRATAKITEDVSSKTLEI